MEAKTQFVAGYMKKEDVACQRRRCHMVAMFVVKEVGGAKR